jgi:hypothetical protein
MIADLDGLARFERAVCCSDGLGLSVRRDYFLGDGSRQGLIQRQEDKRLGQWGGKGYFLDLTCLSLPSTLKSETWSYLDRKICAFVAISVALVGTKMKRIRQTAADVLVSSNETCKQYSHLGWMNSMTKTCKQYSHPRRTNSMAKTCLHDNSCDVPIRNGDLFARATLAFHWARVPAFALHGVIACLSQCHTSFLV